MQYPEELKRLPEIAGGIARDTGKNVNQIVPALPFCLLPILIGKPDEAIDCRLPVRIGGFALF